MFFLFRFLLLLLGFFFPSVRERNVSVCVCGAEYFFSVRVNCYYFVLSHWLLLSLFCRLLFHWISMNVIYWLELLIFDVFMLCVFSLNYCMKFAAFLFCLFFWWVKWIRSLNVSFDWSIPGTFSSFVKRPPSQMICVVYTHSTMFLLFFFTFDLGQFDIVRDKQWGAHTTRIDQSIIDQALPQSFVSTSQSYCYWCCYYHYSCNLGKTFYTQSQLLLNWCCAVYQFQLKPHTIYPIMVIVCVRVCVCVIHNNHTIPVIWNSRDPEWCYAHIDLLVCHWNVCEHGIQPHARTKLDRLIVLKQCQCCEVVECRLNATTNYIWCGCLNIEQTI